MDSYCFTYIFITLNIILKLVKSNSIDFGHLVLGHLAPIGPYIRPIGPYPPLSAPIGPAPIGPGVSQRGLDNTVAMMS